MPGDDGVRARGPRMRLRQWAELTRGPAHRAAQRGADPVPAELLRPTSRRRELLAPALVILAGVLAVVAVAVAMGWGLHRQGDPVAQPVLPPLAPTDWNLPTPTPTGGGSAKPSESASSGSPRPPSSSAPPTSAPPVKAPPGNTLTIVRAAVPSTVDLSAEGSRDWVHWGFDKASSLERRKKGKPVIAEGRPTGSRHRHALSPQRFAWNDGEPVAGTTGTPTGIRTCGAKNGFTINAPADPIRRKLRLYVGVANGHGRLEARLTTGGKPVTATLDSRSPMGTAVFTLTYRAPRDGSLKVTWTTQKSYGTSCAGVALQAATLR